MGYAVTSGNFCSVPSPTCAGKWPIRSDLDGPSLKRNFGSLFPVQPGVEVVNAMMAEVIYDSPPFDNFSTGFRNKLEGWGGLMRRIVCNCV